MVSIATELVAVVVSVIASVCGLWEMHEYWCREPCANNWVSDCVPFHHFSTLQLHSIDAKLKASNPQLYVKWLRFTPINNCVNAMRSSVLCSSSSSSVFICFHKLRLFSVAFDSIQSNSLPPWIRLVLPHNRMVMFYVALWRLATFALSFVRV